MKKIIIKNEEIALKIMIHLNVDKPSIKIDWFISTDENICCAVRVWTHVLIYVFSGNPRSIIV